MALYAKRAARVGVWLAALCGGAIAANADSVIFSTASTSVSNGNNGNSGTVTFTGTTSTAGQYTYDPTAASTTISPVFLGDFSGVDGPNNKDFDNAPISIALTESLPGTGSGSGTGDFTATIAGHLNQNKGTVIVTFDSPATFDIPDTATGLDVTYSLNVSSLTFGISSPPTELDGTITVTSTSLNPNAGLPAAPLPASFSSGLGVFGLLAVAAGLRRRNRTLA